MKQILIDCPICFKKDMDIDWFKHHVQMHARVEPPKISYIQWLLSRIESAEKLNLPEQYINGLKDAHKILIKTDPILELVR